MDKIIRVLYVHPYTLDCGPYRSLLMLLQGLDKTRFLPLVVMPAPCDTGTQLIAQGFEVLFDSGVTTVPRSYWPCCQLKFLAAALTAGFRLSRQIRQKNIDLVHVNSESCWMGCLAAKLAGIPAITHLRGLSVLSPAWAGHLTIFILNHLSNLLLATSYQVQRAFASMGANPKNLRTLYNGINTRIFDPAQALPTLRTELGIGKEQPLIGMIAHFDWRKGHHHFIHACIAVSQKIADAQFVFVGTTHYGSNDNYCKNIKELAEQSHLKNRVHFLGIRHDIPNILASLDVVVQPSLTEAGPRVPIEAMAMERPIIVSDTGGNSEEVLHEQTGLVVPVGDTQALADAIIRVLGDVSLARQLGKAGRKRVLDLFSQEQHIREINRLYEQLAEKKYLD